MDFKNFGKVLFAGALVTLSLNFTACLTDDDDDDDDTTTTVTNDLKMKEVTLGAQDNAAPSSVDLDTWMTYNAAAAPAASAMIDIVFAYSTASSAAAIYSPLVAKNGVAGSSGFDFMANWTSPNNTSLRTVTIADMSKIKTSADVKKLYDDGMEPSPAGRIAVNNNTTLVARTDKDLYVLLQVTSVTQAANGTAAIKGWAKW